MTAAPWMKFYPSDWRSDPRLRMCGLAARGLWMEMIALMHEATPYGHLLVSGKPPTDIQLAMLAGTSPDQIPALLGELEAAGVFSRTGKGVIYSRRMTRDDKRTRAARANGKLGGNPSLCKTNENPEPDKLRDIPPDKPQSPEARSQTESNARAQDIGAGGQRSNRAKPLPDDFQIPADWLAEAEQKRRQSGLPAANLKLEAEQFIAHSLKNAATSFDWRRSWIGWALRARTMDEGTGKMRPKFVPL